MSATSAATAIIPVFNAEDSIARAIRSVLDQTLPAEEVLVVDDGSTDNSAHVVSQFGSKVRYLYQINAGASAARNLAIREARRDWVAFLDADDVWKPDRLERQFEVLRRNPDLKWAAGSFNNISSGRVDSIPRTRFSHKLVENEVASDALELMGNGWSIWTGTVIIRRDVFAEVGDFDEQQRTSHDLDLWIRIAAKYPRIGWISDPVADYEINPDGLTLTSVAIGDPTLIRLHERAIELTDQLSTERKPHLRSFTEHHGRLLLRDTISAGRSAQARKLIGQFDELGVPVSSRLKFASWIPGRLITTLRSGKQFILGR